MKMIFSMLIILSVTVGPLAASDTKILTEDFLTLLRDEAARAHPVTDIAAYRVSAAEKDLRSIRLWDDPMIGLGFMAAEEMMQQNDGDIAVGIEQRLPKPGIYQAERSKMRAMQAVESENARSTVLGIGSQVAKDAIELALADESILLQQAQLDWLAEMVKNARQMAADPMGSSADALRMEMEIAKEQQTLDALHRSREGFAQKLNLTLGRPLNASWDPLHLPANPLPVPLAASEVARISAHNPAVLAKMQMVAAAGADTKIADRDRMPEISVGVDSRSYSGGDYRSTMVAMKMSLPWFNDRSYQAKIDAAKIRENAAESEVEAIRRVIAASIISSITEAANAAAQARAYSGEIHEKAVRASESVQAAWLNLKSPLQSLLDSRRLLVAIRLEQRRMIAMQLSALEDLQALVPNR